MKKILSNTLTVFICLGMLSGCGNEEFSETFSETSVTSVETVPEILEAAEKEITETEIAEETTVSETETTAETEQKMPSYEVVDMSNYTGNFYEWEYDYDIVVYDRESFSGGEDIINTAARTVRENVTYKINEKDYTYFEIAFLAEKAEKSEKYRGYVFEIDGERAIIYNDTYERFLDENGRLEPYFTEGVYEDFDGDGKKEGFLCFGLINPDGLFDNIYYVVFVDAEGNAELIPEASGMIFDWGEMLNPIRYNGFIHMCTAFGLTNGTHHSEIYAVENDKAVHKKSMFSPGRTFCGAFMLESAAQAPGSWISFWNENEREYYILDTEDITDEEAEALRNSEAFRGNESLFELYESTEQLKKYSGITGKKYYGVSSGFWIEAFERINGTFEKSEYEIICPYYKNEIYAVGVDIDKAQAEMIRLEK